MVEGVALARARLAVREHRAVEAGESVIEHRGAEVLVDGLLARVLRTWPGARARLRRSARGPGSESQERERQPSGSPTLSAAPQQPATRARLPATPTMRRRIRWRGRPSLLHTPWPLWRPCRRTELTRARDGLVVAGVVSLEAIVAPVRVVEGKLLLLLVLRVDERGDRTFHLHRVRGVVARTHLGSAGGQELSHTLIMQEDFASFSRPLNGRTRTATFTDSTLDMAAEHCARRTRITAVP